MGSQASPSFEASEVPAPLPTIEAIAASRYVLQDVPNRVVRVGKHYVVKYGAAVSLTEGENMLFVKQHSDIPLPAVYAFFSHQGEDEEMPVNYIVMEYIAGDTLESRWNTLNNEEKTDVAGQLRKCFTQLRQIPSSGYFGLLGKQPFGNSVFWTDDDDVRQQISGPFDTQMQMVDALLQKYQHSHPKPRKADFYRRVLPLTLHDHASVFTHGDFQRKNVLLRNDGTVVIIDWEAAGWYPSFWEYAITLFSCRWNDDWHVWVADILDEYLNEYAWMNTLFFEIWY
jgi:aminoglycoside phosphotransferase (APT) family kinase protein